ncbi:MAG: signal peptidase I [Chloroflexi bacterium]|nr:signal peptidase I [Chloroflexota bacterium]
MISETARPEIRADSPQRKWVLWAGRLARLLVTLGVLALLGALLAAAAPRLLGYQSYVIYGSSMEPTIRLGSLILTEPVDAEQLQVGDIIAFRTPNEITVTHRIVAARHEDGQHYFKTKGDASNGGDPTEVRLEGSVHRLAYKLPYLGYFVDFAKSPLGMIFLIALPAAALLASSFSKRSRPQRRAEAEAPPEG